MTVWLSTKLVQAIHDEQLHQHGGASGIRDPGMLESALARPLNRAGYGDPDIAELAALYAIGIARNHPFVDGNKRTAYVALEIFLEMSGCMFEATDADIVITMLRLAGGDISDDDFTAWVRQHASAPA